MAYNPLMSLATEVNTFALTAGLRSWLRAEETHLRSRRRVAHDVVKVLMKVELWDGGEV